MPHCFLDVVRAGEHFDHVLDVVNALPVFGETQSNRRVRIVVSALFGGGPIPVSATRNNVDGRWPTNYAGFDYSGYILQSTTNLGSSGVWTANSPAPVVVNGQKTVTNPISGTQQFFRLNQ